jgi:hypothetical protein
MERIFCDKCGSNSFIQDAGGRQVCSYCRSIYMPAPKAAKAAILGAAPGPAALGVHAGGFGGAGAEGFGQQQGGAGGAGFGSAGASGFGSAGGTAPAALGATPPPGSTAALLQQAAAAANSGDRARAKRLYSMILELDPFNQQARAALGSLR